MPMDPLVLKRLDRIERRLDALESRPKGQSIGPTSPPGKKQFIISVCAWFATYFLSMIYFIDYSTAWFIQLASIISGIIGFYKWMNAPSQESATASSRRQETIPRTSTQDRGRKVTATARASASTSTKEESLESQVGTRWIGWAGIIALVLGIGYFVVYAITNQWIGPIGQILTGCLSGILLVAGARVLENRNGSSEFIRILEGGGFALLYFSVYAAYGIYPAETGMNPYIDMAILTIVSLVASFYAIQTNSKTVAIEAFVLGYATPLLITGVELFTLCYSLILTIALTFIAYKQSWDTYILIPIGFSYFIHSAWLQTHTDSVLLNGAFLLAYLAIFSTYGYFATQRPKTSIEEKTLILPVWILAILTVLFAMSAQPTISFLALIPLLGFCLFIIRRVFEINYLEYFTYGSVYLLQYQWLSNNISQEIFLQNAIIVTVYLACSLIHPFLDPGKRTIGQRIGFDALSALGYYSIMYWTVSRYYPFAEGMFTLGLSAIYLIIAWIHARREEHELCDSRLAMGLAFLSIAIPLQLNQQWITLAWFTEALVLSHLGIRRNDLPVKLFGHAAAFAGTVRLLFFDMNLARFTLDNPLGATRLGVFVFSILCLYTTCIQYIRDTNDEETRSIWAYWFIATFLTSLIIFIEINQSTMTTMAQSLATTIAWAIQASVITGIGFWKDLRFVRLTGLGILGVCILKAFLLDLAGLEQPYRFISLIILGLILLGVSFVYTHYKTALEKIL